MINAVVDVVVVLVVVLRGYIAMMDIIERRIIGTAVVLVLGQIGIRQQRRCQMLKTGIVRVDDAAAASR